MTPEERANEIITWSMPDSYRTVLVCQIASQIRIAEAKAVDAETERCLRVIASVEGRWPDSAIVQSVLMSLAEEISERGTKG
jgi:hypothetical protein